VLIRGLIEVQEVGNQYTYIENADSYLNLPIMGLNQSLCKGRSQTRGEDLTPLDVPAMVGVFPKTNATETLLNKMGVQFEIDCRFYHLA